MPLSQKHILLAEDEKGLQRVLSLMLRQNNFKVSSCSNGEEAFNIISTLKGTGNSIDLLVTDIMMPKCGGVELLDRLIDHGIRIPTIVITGHAGEDLLDNLQLRGCCEYIFKPFEPEDLMISVHKAVRDQENRNFLYQPGIS